MKAFIVLAVYCFWLQVSCFWLLVSCYWLLVSCYWFIIQKVSPSPYNDQSGSRIWKKSMLHLRYRIQ
ncbi:MAG TPA: hypothetical protein DCO78_04295 [Chitinophagaceae bacterium]|nr:hypothetical protein [Chitinophagaceae bacterium]